MAQVGQLPAGWEECKTEDGYVYYYNSTTDESSWEFPTESGAPASSASTNLPDGWQECTDDDGNIYYFNSTTGESSWEFPSSTSTSSSSSTPSSSSSSTSTSTSSSSSLFSRPKPPLLSKLKSTITSVSVPDFTKQSNSSSTSTPSLSKTTSSATFWSAKKKTPASDMTSSSPPSTSSSSSSSSSNVFWSASKSKPIPAAPSTSSPSSSSSSSSNTFWSASKSKSTTTLSSSAPTSSSSNTFWSAKGNRKTVAVEEEPAHEISWPTSYYNGQVDRGPKVAIPSDLLELVPEKDVGKFKVVEDSAPPTPTRPTPSIGGSTNSKCPGCSEPIINATKFCTNCGHKLADVTSSAERALSPPRGRLPSTPNRSMTTRTLSPPPTPSRAISPPPARPTRAISPPPTRPEISESNNSNISAPVLVSKPNPITAKKSMASIPIQTKPKTEDTPTRAIRQAPTVPIPPVPTRNEEEPPRVPKREPVAAPPADFPTFMRNQGVSDDVIQLLVSQKVGFDNMNELDHEALKEIGVGVWGDRTKVLNAVKAYSSNGAAPAASSTPSGGAAPPATPTSTQSSFNLGTSPTPSAGKASFFKKAASVPASLSAPVQAKETPTSSVPAPVPGPSISSNAVFWSASGKNDDDEKKKAEKAAADERRRQEKEMQKKEEEIIKTKGISLQLQKIKEKKEREELIQNQINPATCSCSIRVVQYDVTLKSNKKPDFVSFKIDIEFGGSSWSINRRYKQFTQMDFGLREVISGIVVLPPSSQDKKQKFDPDFLQQRAYKLNEYVQQLVNLRSAIFASDRAASFFCRFFAPVQWGDVKPPDFVLPFKQEYITGELSAKKLFA